jgi:carbonic anhydrase/acetyltransferase-like protein (isoleucine patch superfamily)
MLRTQLGNGLKNDASLLPCFREGNHPNSLAVGIRLGQPLQRRHAQFGKFIKGMVVWRYAHACGGKMTVSNECKILRKSMAIYQLGEDAPEIDPSAYVTETANVIGKAKIEANASIWFDVTIRGDNELISIGENSNVQEGCILHTDPGFPLTIEKNVTVGHQAMLHGCTIGEGSLVGIQAVILNGAKIGRNCLVGAGALVTEGKEFPDNSLIIGTPAKAVRTLTEEDIARMQRNTANYVKRGQQYKTALKRIG